MRSGSQSSATFGKDTQESTVSEGTVETMMTLSPSEPQLDPLCKHLLAHRVTCRQVTNPLAAISATYSFIRSFHWHVQNSTIPCRSQKLLPSSLLYAFSCHPCPPTILPSSLLYAFSCHPCPPTILPFLSVICSFLPPFSANSSSILSHLILPSISWSTSQSCFSKIYI